VRYLKAVSIFVLLGLWLVAGNHCYLEGAGLLPADGCHTAANGSATSDPCENGCKVAEKAGYKTQVEQQVVLSAELLSFVVAPDIADRLSPTQISLVSCWPPQALHLPQFVISTALPVRAPSFAS
jgi:hypothetical protein